MQKPQIWSKNIISLTDSHNPNCPLGKVQSTVIRRIHAVGMLLTVMGGWMMTRAVVANTLSAPVDHQMAGGLGYAAWIGGGLSLLGVAGSVIMLLGQRRRLRATRDQLQAHIVTLNDRQRELETELEHRRQTSSARQRELETELERQRQTGETLHDSERRFRSLIQQLPVGVFMSDTQGEYRYVNDRWCVLAGLTAEQATGSGWMQAVHPDDRETVLQTWQQLMAQGTELVTNHRFRSPSGRVNWLNTRAVPLRDRAGRITGYLGANTDIAELKRVEDTLRASEARFRSYFELPLIGIAVSGPDKRWWEVNDRLCEMLGYPRAQLLSLSWAELTYPEDLGADIARFERVMSRRIEGYSIEKRFIRQDGALLYASVSTRCVRRASGMAEYFVTVIQDITEQKQAEQRAQHLSQYDTLTGLPNRALLSDRLAQAVARANREQHQVVIMLVDLDRFKVINDTLSHTAGDHLLCEVAARLKLHVSEGDTISRQGGDEFAVLLPDLDSSDTADRIAQQLLESVAEPYQLNDHELHVTCSIGLSVYPRDGHNADILLKNADIALYRAKDMGRNNYQFYLSGATVLSRERLDLETGLRRAVEQEQLELYYQPKWDFRNSVIIGAEALVRWNHPDLGLLPPARFIPIAEESGLILLLGNWVLQTAIREIGQMHRRGFAGLEVAVNLSARQFKQADLVEQVRESLGKSGFDPKCLELELTESILMGHTEDNMATLRALRAMGVRIAIDDFGTGYSSLSYLQRFPMNVLKIDRAFVMNLPDCDSSAAIVDAIIMLAHGLSLTVVAEGVETAEQAAFLNAHGCNTGQGYYFGRPLPLVEFQRLLFKDRARLMDKPPSQVNG